MKIWDQNYSEELTTPVELCQPGGHLNPEAMGYSRSLVHVPNLPGGPRWWGRNKRWEYWGIVTADHIIGLTIADLDYAGLLQLYLWDRRSGQDLVICEEELLPFGRGVDLPDAVPPFTASGKGKLELIFDYGQGSDRLRLDSPRVQLDLEVMPGGDALGVVIPWSSTRFQYTVKDVARQIRGSLVVDGQTFEIDKETDFAVLDRGRGRWPYAMTWNWGAGFQRRGDHSLGLQVGAKWTAGTPGTENALFVDGDLHYFPDELHWTYDADDEQAHWHIEGEQLEARLEPFHLRRAQVNALIIANKTLQAFGRWSGWAIDNDGQRHDLDGLIGWAEEVHNRW